MIVPQPVLRRLSAIRREEGIDSSQIMRAGIIVIAGMAPEARTATIMIAEDCTSEEQDWAFQTIGDAATAVLSDILQKRVDQSG